MTDLENIEKGIHFNRNYSKTGFTKKTLNTPLTVRSPYAKV